MSDQSLGSVKQVVRQKKGKYPSLHKDIMWCSKCSAKQKSGKAESVPWGLGHHVKSLGITLYYLGGESEGKK